MVVDGWDSKEGEWSPDESSLAMRACKMREWLKEREEEEIIVVTHGGIQPISAARFILALLTRLMGRIFVVFGGRDKRIRECRV